MISILRPVGAMVAAIAVTAALVVAVELLGGIVHPLPGDFSGTIQEVCRHVQAYPPWFLAGVVAAWGVTAFAGTWTAGRLGNSGCALFLGALVLSGLIFNILKLPYPLWFKIASLLVMIMAVVCGFRLSSRRVDTAASVTEAATTNC